MGRYDNKQPWLALLCWPLLAGFLPKVATAEETATQNATAHKAAVHKAAVHKAAVHKATVLEDVIVTARKRAESLQETPLAVTALDADALRDAGINNLADLNILVPGIDVSLARGAAPQASVYIRGVGQRNTGANIDPGVGIYIDNVYVGRPDGALLDLNDIASVQVLRGPQGTLFGKNTTGGALVFTTNRPVGELEGQVGLRVGNYDRLDGDLVVNVPLADKLWTRFSGVHRSRDGFIDNLYDGKAYLDEDRQSVIWQTRWVPDQTLTIDLNINWAETEQLMRPNKCQLVPGVTGWQAALFDAVAIGPSLGATLDDFCLESANAGGGDPLTVRSDLGGDYRAENRGASLIAEWELSDSLTIKSITGWRYTEAEQNDELDHTAIPFLHRTNSIHPLNGPSKTDQYSQEFQLTGDAYDQRLQYVAGLYWYREETAGRIDANFLGPFDPSLGDTFFLNASASTLTADNTAVAAFAQGEWEFNARWRATLGVRYTDEERKLERIRYRADSATLDLNGGPVVDIGNGLFAVSRPGFAYNPHFDFVVRDNSSGKSTDDDVSPMASLQYSLDDLSWVDTGSLYLTYSEGFLSGGLSEGPSDALEEFKPEEVTNWELGFKLDLLDRRLRVNGALFHSDYKNRQLTSLAINVATSSPAPTTINAAESTIQGFELETTWLPFEFLTLTMNATITDGDIDEFDDQQITIGDPTRPAPPGCDRANLLLFPVEACPIDRSNENLPRLAEQSYLLAAQFIVPSPIGLLLPRLQASWKKDIDFCLDSSSCNTDLWLEDEQFDLSARLTWMSPDEKWTGALYGSNLTDEDYLVGGVALVDSAGVGGFAVAAPRMYGAELRYHF